MGMRTVEAVVPTNGSADAAWALLADLPAWASWAPVGSVTVEQPGDAQGVGMVRLMRTGPLKVRERAEVLDADARRFEYTLVSGLPIRDYRAVVTVAKEGDAARITWRSTFRPLIPGTGIVFATILRKVLGDYAAALAKAADR